jgi:predicted nucleotidyltransferase
MSALDPRIVLANQIIEVLEKEEHVQSVYLRGSLSHGKTDEYSDIDIGIDVSGYDNGQYALNLFGVLNEHFSIIFNDWAPSLLPDQYVQSFFFKDTSPFWFVDIECNATPHVRSVTNIHNDRVGHHLKLWILNAKYYLRGMSQEYSIYQFGKKVLEVQDLHNLSPKEIMRLTLETIHRNSTQQYEDIITKCSQICSKIEETFN